MPPKKKVRETKTPFKQQQLKAWQPLISPKGIIPLYFAVGVVFIPIGVWLYLASDKVKEVLVDYSSCSVNGTFNYPITNWAYNATSRNCTIDFKIDEDITGPVYLYYRLTAFNQNHRLFLKSYDYRQLEDSGGLTPDGSCDPLSKPSQVSNYASIYSWASNASLTDSAAFIYPCGRQANSYFNDFISDLTPTSPAGSPISFSPSGIAWSTGSSRYKKSTLPSRISGNLTTTIFPPPRWVEAFPGADFSKGYTAANFPDISQMERLQVWMKPSGLPIFRKTWGSVSNTIAAGSYRVVITHNFDSLSYGGSKALALSSVSAIGGKNHFFGIAYTALGGACWVLGIVFLLVQMIKPRKRADASYLSWNRNRQLS
ncbi:CDC50/LEM3 family [Zopfochytrium polystomum]|nr:CDC50/LEM3 family [Zopfochytrium polystomum]